MTGTINRIPPPALAVAVVGWRNIFSGWQGLAWLTRVGWSVDGAVKAAPDRLAAVALRVTNASRAKVYSLAIA